MTTKKKILIGLTCFTLISTIMTAFYFLKKPKARTVAFFNPYKDSSVNLTYNLLFCDNLNLYKETIPKPYVYPFDILFSENSSSDELQRIIDDKDSNPRIKVLAYNRQLSLGHKPNRIELVAVIVEVGLVDGLCVLASFSNGNALYINQTGKTLVWENSDETSNKIYNELFRNSSQILDKKGFWDNPRQPSPTKGNVRVTYLVSDGGGLSFGEEPMDTVFSNPKAGAALTSVIELMRFLTEKSLENEKSPSANTIFTHFRASLFGLVHSPLFSSLRGIHSASLLPKKA